MKLGIVVGYGGPRIALPLELIRHAERLGFDSCWTSEAYGPDAVSVSAWLLAHTSRIKVGTAILQMPARAPTMAAMTAISLNQLSGGRFILGLGPSGPQVVEGWYGASYAKPLTRMREYIAIMRQVFERSAPVQYDIAPFVSVAMGDDVQACRDLIKPSMALYIGGMGARGKNFYTSYAGELGYGDAARRVQDLYLDGKKAEAALAIPDQLVDDVALVGPKERIRERLQAWIAAGKEHRVGTMILASHQPDALEVIADAVL